MFSNGISLGSRQSISSTRTPQHLLNEPYKEGMNMIFDKKSLSSNPSFYVHAPTRTDSTAAPENQDTLSVIIPVGHVDES